MAMKWQNLNEREIELSFDSGTRILIVDRRNVAAEVVLPNQQRVYLKTSYPMSPADQHRIMVWWGSQPHTIKSVSNDVFEQIIKKENQQ
jgi:hypothetical protein